MARRRRGATWHRTEWRAPRAASATYPHPSVSLYRSCTLARSWRHYFAHPRRALSVSLPIRLRRRRPRGAPITRPTSVSQLDAGETPACTTQPSDEPFRIGAGVACRLDLRNAAAKRHASELLYNGLDARWASTTRQSPQNFAVLRKLSMPISESKITVFETTIHHTIAFVAPEITIITESHR